jgi:hypothetical protein
MRALLILMLVPFTIVGCKNTGAICETNSTHEYCIDSNYNESTRKMIDKYHSLENKKAFAFASAGKWQFVGIGYDYRLNSEAIEAALSEYNTRSQKLKVKAKCEIIKIN